MAIGIKTSVKRKSNKKAKKNIAEQKEPDLLVGIFPRSRYEDGTAVAQIAHYQEFGTHDGLVIPPRPAWRLTVREKRSSWVKDAIANLKSLTGDARAIWKAYNNLGILASRDIQFKIGSNVPPALAEQTKAAKRKLGIADWGRSLIGKTGSLQKSVEYENKVK